MVWYMYEFLLESPCYPGYMCQNKPAMTIQSNRQQLTSNIIINVSTTIQMEDYIIIYRDK